MGTAYRLKENFFGIYDAQSPDEACICAGSAAIPPDLADAFHDLMRAWENWDFYILAYFDHLVTNAYTQSLNNLIRVMNRLGRGYSFEALRAKILFAEGAHKHKSAQPKFERKATRVPEPAGASYGFKADWGGYSTQRGGAGGVDGSQAASINRIGWAAKELWGRYFNTDPHDRKWRAMRPLTEYGYPENSFRRLGRTGVTERLAAISRDIVVPGKSYLELLPQAEALRDLIELRAGFCIDPGRDIGDGQTRLDSGLAISPTLAAMCLREHFRTLAFIRGLAEAIDDAGQPGRPVRVLYAGCGPYALLAVPLMTLHSREQAVFILMDIHTECLDSARRLIDSFGLDNVDGYLCADAAHYRIPADRLPDVIVSETMAVCLRNEPQVAIARNLLTQAPAARLVPRSVRVDACLLDPGKEIAGLPAEDGGEPPAPRRDRLSLGTVFSLDAESISSWTDIEGDRLPGGAVTLPAPLGERYRPFLLTKIDVYGDNRLRDYDCSLTLPRPWPGKPVFSGGERLRFHYRLSDHPELGYEVAARTNP